MHTFDKLLSAEQAVCNLIYPRLPYHGVLDLRNGGIEFALMSHSPSQGNFVRSRNLVEGSVVLQTQDEQFVTIFGVHEHSSQVSATNFTQLCGNEVIIGNRRWYETYRVGRIEVSAPEVKNGFTDHEAWSRFLRKFSNGETLDEGEFPKVSFFHDGVRVEIKTSYGLTFSPYKIEVLDPTISFEFDDPVSLEEAIERVMCIRTFLELSFGLPLEIHTYFVRREGREEAQRKIANSEQPDVFCVYHRPGVGRVKTESGFGSGRMSMDLNAGLALYSGINDTEIGACTVAMQKWYWRWEEWANANVAISRMVRFGNLHSADRLINACNWLERIPEHGPNRQDLAKPVVKELLSRVNKIAVELGIEDRRERIRGCIGKIASESQSNWINRLIAMVDERLPGHLDRERFCENIVSGLGLRADAAHGRLKELEERGGEVRARATHSVEIMCMLLSVQGLELAEVGAETLRSRISAKMLP